jgi:hypothetical protein
MGGGDLISIDIVDLSVIELGRVLENEFLSSSITINSLDEFF